MTIKFHWVICRLTTIERRLNKLIYLWGLNFLIIFSWQKHPKLK